ncbi:MAG: hypothetical protein AB1938_11865 [Myxococcota bacterium]
MALQPSQAHCATHADAAAIGPCIRCGRFACEGCASTKEPILCTTCAPAVTDPLGLKARPFAVFDSLGRGLTLAATELPRILAISLAFSIPGGALDLLVQTPDPMMAALPSARLSSLHHSAGEELGEMRWVTDPPFHVR